MTITEQPKMTGADVVVKTLEAHSVTALRALLSLIAKDREQLMAEAASLSAVPIHPLRLIAELQDILTPDVTVCFDMGSFSMYLATWWGRRNSSSITASQVSILVP
jgi:thiamine pyrophosphate-dependent acetolactate synthase large subunit-like protein